MVELTREEGKKVTVIAVFRAIEGKEKDLEKRFSDKLDTLLLDVLEILENVERAAGLASSDKKTREGLELLSQSLANFLRKNDIAKVSPEGEEFDPNRMEALQVAPGPKGKVIRVYQCGYLKGDKLLKPAKVVVGGGE